MSAIPIAIGVGSFVNAIVSNVRRGLSMLFRYARLVVRYLWQYLRLAWRTVARFFAVMQRHPKETLQFAGTLLILINAGVL